MREADLQAAVMELARRESVLAHHCGDSRLCQGTPGFPDTILAGPRGLILAELKLAGKRMEGDQLTWAYTLVAAGIRHYLFTPADLEDGKIERQLRRIRG
jgi:hypothetical protein